ncbi:unnamed protein product [Plutella xylostella]|uniref:(diamondback moth) hypothetical protein n=1 Tax=Plutella xylostella TaxID=51655 RepID=A0A8S4FV07_PLUXY|nr:unnamed protein product [Plutella xylostella]
MRAMRRAAAAAAAARNRSKNVGGRRNLFITLDIRYYDIINVLAPTQLEEANLSVSIRIIRFKVQVTPVLAWSGGEQAAGAFDVSWIRHRDLHILTVGGYTYTSDQRFQASHAPLGDDWTLHIKWAQQRDAGVYECQVSTQPVRSYFVTLHVVDCEDVYQRMAADAGRGLSQFCCCNLQVCLFFTNRPAICLH